MKSKHKNISFILLIVLSITLLSGCNPNNTPKEDTILNAGFIESKLVEDGKNYIVVGLNGDNLKLEVGDKDMYGSLEEDEFYIFSYTSSHSLNYIQWDSYLKSLALKDREGGLDDSAYEEILPKSNINLDDFILLDEYIIDFNDDGYDERIGMYVDAERSTDGKIMWDDGQRWTLVVHGKDQNYVLFDDYVQLGSVRFNVYTKDDGFYITTINTGTANLTIGKYKYNQQNDSFLYTQPFVVDGNVNMLYNSKDLHD